MPSRRRGGVARAGYAGASQSELKIFGGLPVVEQVLERKPTPPKPAVERVNKLQVGEGAEVASLLSGTTTWDPASVADGANDSTTVTVTDASVGNPVFVGFSQAVPAGVLLVGAVTAADTVTVTLQNHSGSPVDLASGTLRAVVVTF